MAREKETYRSILDRLDEKFPDKEVLTQQEFADYLGRARWYVNKHYADIKNSGKKGGYNKTSIAKALAR